MGKKAKRDESLQATEKENGGTLPTPPSYTKS
jgi:hypothetical protein